MFFRASTNYSSIPVPRLAREVACPDCSAPPGYFCVTKTGNARNGEHDGRVASYRAVTRTQMNRSSLVWSLPG